MSSSEANKPPLDLSMPEANNFTIPDLITHLQSTFIPHDFDLVTRILSAREDQAKKAYALLEEMQNAFEDELKSCFMENEELREEMSRSKDGYESCIAELRGRIECMERDERKAEALVKLYRSRFEKVIRRVVRLEDDAKVLLMPDQPRVDEEEEEEAREGNSTLSNGLVIHEQNGESQGQLSEEIASASKEKKKAGPSNSKSEPAMPVESDLGIEPQTQAVSKTQALSDTIDTNNKMASPSNGRNSTRDVIEIIDSDDEQPVGVMASTQGVSTFGGVDCDGSRSDSQIGGGEIKVPEDLNVSLDNLCTSQCPTAPTTAPIDNIDTSGTSKKLNSVVLRPCGKKLSSGQTSECLTSQINKHACKDSSSDDNGDWKNEEDMITALEKDPELCIRAICALYREKSFNGSELHNPQHEDMIMASTKDPELCMKAICALRGTALAEFFINGDPRAELKKDEKDLRDCKRIAKVYSKKLFEIYKKDKDQLLLPLENFKTPTLVPECNGRSSTCMDCLNAANAEEKELELLFLQWSEHHQKLCSFPRTKAEPPIYYVFNQPLEEDAALVEQRKEQIFQEWKASRREELSKYKKQIAEQNIANLEAELERWQNAMTARRGNNNTTYLQVAMNQELETHTLEHGPETSKLPGALPGAAGNNDENEGGVEDINGAENDMIDDVLDVEESSGQGEEDDDYRTYLVE